MIKKCIRALLRRMALALFLLVGRWRRTEATDGERILVVRLDEIGDMVLLSPFLRGLRELYPAAHITLVTKPVCMNLIELCPHIDAALAFAPARGHLALPRTLCRAYRFCRTELAGPFSLAIAPRFDADASYLAGAVVYMSGAARRVGYPSTATAGKAISDRGLDAFYTELVPVRAGACHEAVRSYDVLRCLGYTGAELDLELYTSAEDRERAAELTPASADSLRIAMALSTGARHRLWPRERYAAVMRALARRHRCTFILMGGTTTRRSARVIYRQSAQA